MLNTNTATDAGKLQTDEVRALYHQAARDEYDFCQLLREGLGYEVTASTNTEDRYDDIDFWIHRYVFGVGCDQKRGISLKTTRYKRDRVPLELYTWIWQGEGEAPRRGYESQSKFCDAWFFTSKADVFAFENDGLYYLFDVQQLREWVSNKVLSQVLKGTTTPTGRHSVWVNGDKVDLAYLNPSTPRNKIVADSYSLWFTPHLHPEAGLLGVINKYKCEIQWTVGQAYDKDTINLR